jgi:class 3 adenylate cyclase
VIGVPEVQYAREGDLHIAYQVWGDGPVDLVLVWGLFSHCQLFWEDPVMAGFLDELGRFARVVQFDKRGTGMSDSIVGIPTLDQRMDDVRIVMDAVGMDRAILLGESEGGPMCCLFAATFPGRVTKLILYAAIVHMLNDDEFVDGLDPAAFPGLLESMVEQWGTGAWIDLGLPSRAADPAARDGMARFERLALTRGAFRDLMMAIASIDIRPVLPLVNVPTVVIHRLGDMLVPPEQGRYAAAHIPGARFVGLPGIDHIFAAGDVDALVREIRLFVTGRAEAPSSVSNRCLATVLFTDIVGSTQRAAEAGDRKWHDLLDRHNALVREELSKFRGIEIDTAGDSFLATFDGPARAIQCALSICERVRALGMEVRAGLHTGEVETMENDITGIAVHIGSRVSSLARPGEVLVSRTVTDLVAGSGIEFEDRGEHELKGVPGSWTLFAVKG